METKDIKQDWTALFLKNLNSADIAATTTSEGKPCKLPYKLPDPENKGLIMQITVNGRKTFYYRYQNRDSKKREFVPLGQFTYKQRNDMVTLSQVREKYHKARDIYINRKLNPREYFQAIEDEESDKRQQAELKRKAENSKGTIEQLFDLKIADLEKNSSSSAKSYKSAFKSDVYPVIPRDTKANVLDESSIREILAPIVARGKLSKANHVHSYLSSAFRFGIEYDNAIENHFSNIRFGIKRNPVRDVPKPMKGARVGERTLSEAEIKQFWESLSDLSTFSTPTEFCIKLLFATGGQRVTEILQATWGEINIADKLWVIPRARTKNRKCDHVIPLTERAIDLLTRLKKYNSIYRLESDYLFPKRVPREQGEPKQKPNTNPRIKNDMVSNTPMPLESISQVVSRYLKLNQDFEKFVPRDIRRTCKTLMAKAGIDREIRKRIHNHALTDVDEKHYDKHDYLKEKTEALNKWENNLCVILEDERN